MERTKARTTERLNYERRDEIRKICKKAQRPLNARFVSFRSDLVEYFEKVCDNMTEDDAVKYVAAHHDDFGSLYDHGFLYAKNKKGDRIIINCSVSINYNKSTPKEVVAELSFKHGMTAQQIANYFKLNKRQVFKYIGCVITNSHYVKNSKIDVSTLNLQSIIGTTGNMIIVTYSVGEPDLDSDITSSEEE